MLNFGNKEFRNLQEQVLKNAQDIEILKETPSLSIIFVEELPETGETGYLYLVPKNPDPDDTDADSYDEYVWLEDAEEFELVGTTNIDLQNLSSPIYVTIAEKPEGLSYGLRIRNNGWTSDLQQEGGAKLELTGTAVKTATMEVSDAVNYAATGLDWKIKGDSTYNQLSIEYNGQPNLKLAGSEVMPRNAQNLGNNAYRWSGLYLSDSGKVDFGNNATITKDSSNRLNLNAGGDVRIKIGTESSTYCKASWTPDQSATYNLGSDGLKWNNLYLNDKVYAYESYVTYFNSSSGSIFLKCNFCPNTHNSVDLGRSDRQWKDLYITGYITDGTNSVSVADIVKKPNYTNPNVWASGKLASGTGSATIDYTDETGVGVPDWGLYMFTYGNAQCYLAFTESMWLGMLAGYPIRIACPCLEETGGSVEGNTGNLKIEKTSTTGIIKVTVASTITGSATSTNGWDFQFIKVM